MAVAGGVEYYGKVLARNQALRELMGHPARYTVYGNELQTWRRSRVQLTSRRDHLARLLRTATEGGPDKEEERRGEGERGGNTGGEARKTEQ